MFNFKIDKVVDTLINQSKLFNCTMEVAWNDYMNPLITEQFTLEEVLNYIEDMQILDELEEIVKNENITGYTLEDLKNRNNERLRRG